MQLIQEIMNSITQANETLAEARKLGRAYTYNIEALIEKYDVQTQALKNFPA